MTIIRVGDVVRRIGGDLSDVKRGRKYRVSAVAVGRLRLHGMNGSYRSELFRVVEDVAQWSDVEPGDTVEFEVQGDTLTIKAQGYGTQATVLGWKTTELDGVWDLLSIKKRNPPVPTCFGAKVVYRDRQWVLLHAAMLPALNDTKHTMIWVEINKTAFNWLGHRDIDRETFEVLFEGWQIT